MEKTRMDLERELCDLKLDRSYTIDSFDRRIKILTDRIATMLKEDAEKNARYSTIPTASTTRHYASWTDLEKSNIEKNIDGLVHRRAMMFGRTESAIGYAIARVLKKRGIRVDVVD